MNWPETTEKLRTISTGFFFGAVLVLINKENIKIQGIIISVAAVFMLIGIFSNELIKRRNRQKEIKKQNKQ